MPTDNLKQTWKRLAQFILDSRLAKDLQPNDVTSLERIVAGEEDGLHGLDFRRKATGFEGEKYPPECSAGLYVDMNIDWNHHRFEDEQGNLWGRSKVRTQVSWASWGATDPTLARQRLQLMDEVCGLAEDIDRNFQEEVFWLILTKEQIEEQRLRRENEDRLKLIRTAVVGAARRMLVGQFRVASLPTGTGFSWKGNIDWLRPNRDIWKFDVTVNGCDIFFIRKE